MMIGFRTITPAEILATLPPPQPGDAKPRYFVGLDLGQSQDFTALVVVEKVEHPTASGAVENHYAVRHLERFALGTPYPAVVERVVKLLADKAITGATLIVDGTGVGRPVVDLLTAAKPAAERIVPITITAGDSVTQEGRWRRVPKRDLVAVIQVPLQSGRLKIAAGLPHAQTLADEMKAFRVKITANANEQFESWRERDHDDLLLALACAVWVAERDRGPWLRVWR